MQKEQKLTNKMIEMLTELANEDLMELQDSDLTLVIDKATQIIKSAQAEKLLRKAHLAIKDYYEKSENVPHREFWGKRP